jgi:hypothetical protein
VLRNRKDGIRQDHQELQRAQGQTALLSILEKVAKKRSIFSLLKEETKGCMGRRWQCMHSMRETECCHPHWEQAKNLQLSWQSGSSDRAPA